MIRKVWVSPDDAGLSKKSEEGAKNLELHSILWLCVCFWGGEKLWSGKQNIKIHLRRLFTALLSVKGFYEQNSAGMSKLLQALVESSLVQINLAVWAMIVVGRKSDGSFTGMMHNG